MTSTVEHVQALAAAAEHRGGVEARRADGSFFTDHDVARHLVRRAIGARLLEAVGVDELELEQLLSDNVDLLDELDARTATDTSLRATASELASGIEVLDPTCGAGSFLVAAWAVLDEVASRLGAGTPSPAQMHGVDIDAGAIDACRRTFELLAPGQPVPNLCLADSQRAGVLPPADVVVGNPPYVRASADESCADLSTARVPNRSAWIVERALAAARPSARIAFVLPISTSCTDAFAPARVSWSAACSSVHASHFDTIPATLFAGVVQRLSIYEGRLGSDAAARWYTTRYHRWTRAERDGLLDRVRHVPMPARSIGGSIAKVGTTLEHDLLDRLFAHPPAGRLLVRGGDGSNRIRYKRRWSYFLLFCDFVPGIWSEDGTKREPTELKVLDVDPAVDARALLATYSSTLFWWYFSVFTDNRNVNRRDLAAFPVPDLDPATQAELAALGDELMQALHACSEVRECTYRSIGTIRNTYFRQGETRSVLDRIDRVLARAYGLSNEQLEFVLGFERRFRS